MKNISKFFNNEAWERVGKHVPVMLFKMRGARHEPWIAFQAVRTIPVGVKHEIAQKLRDSVTTKPTLPKGWVALT